MFNFWWSAGLVDELESHLPPLSSRKNEVLIFGLCSTSDDQPGWSMDSKPIHHHSPAKEMKCSFLDYVQLLMIDQAGRRTQTPSPTSFQPTKWNARFGIMFNFWWSAGLVNGLKPHLSPLSSQKNEMLVFALCSTSDDQLGWSMDWNPICHPFQAKKMKYSFLYCIQLLMIGLVIGLEHHPPALSSQKNEMLIFGFYLTSDDQPRWSTDSNPICHLSPAKKMKFSFLHYVQLVIIVRAGQWTQTPSATPFKPKKWNAHFCITFNFWWLGWSLDSNTIHLPSQVKKWNAHFWITFNFWWLAGLLHGLEPHLSPLSSQKMQCSFLDYVQLLMIGRAGQWTQNPSTTPLQPKNDMPIFELCSTSDDRQGWSMDSNPICHLSPAKKMKCLFLDYVQLLMIGDAGRWTQTPSATPLQPKNEMLIFRLLSISGDQPGWSMDSNPIHHPSPAK